MATANLPRNPIPGWEQLRAEWLERLAVLTDTVQSWAEELGWATRRIEKDMDDSQIGAYQAPALLMQEGTTRVLLDPVARFAPGVDGVVDLYLMPAYDDIASLYYQDGNWHLHYMIPGMAPAATTREAPSKLLTRDSFRQVLGLMTRNGQ
jgi:hypothetical protein